MDFRIYEYLSVFIMSWLFVYGLTPFMIRLANKINFVDKPEARKMHLKSVPLMGGLSVALGFVLLCVYDVALSAGRYFDAPMLGYLAGSILIVIIGLIDDKWGMQPSIKMAGQFVVSLLFLLSNFTMTELSAMFGSIFITMPILVLWMVGLMNALNFLDNMDGIISGMAGILGLGFFVFALTNITSSNQQAMALIALISLSFAGSTFGFLPYNFNPAKIFLGDAGSMFIGYFLSSMGILMAQYAGNKYNDKMFYLLPVLLLSYAIFDISLVSYTRRRDGRHVMQGGKDHSTHRINNVLGSVKVTAAIIYAINVLIALTSIIIFRIGSRELLVVSTALFAAFFLIFGRKLDQVPVVIPANQMKVK
ncbi:MAG: MraY family glycosyltransferase [Candidatus Cloacimonadaceae bacterium]|nr:undecaprenyl/decaprenyl-phosphate alpha-N-acetylglucosaminyl 1-phosphate transferase [Candidatus Cloacimonadota bacterium]MCK9335699.1 undecaprenyl/decaprenyl-phosphate alpha-N-acetylglucosaminyl 1-phosphate transferase [Candidatus Cloacimonadota bacterium]MDD2543460.1 MraY family glycosyltransferase [Candidatus Cloacimonadota bacterium]MDD4034725.1 MraY family glycosyltransferase [Candidatus Cloacimonadota bacterium]MDD4667055.1 MraY family glycosyltransferase [Candidatus Cloacimonadota bac